MGPPTQAKHARTLFFALCSLMTGPEELAQYPSANLKIASTSIQPAEVKALHHVVALASGKRCACEMLPRQFRGSRFDTDADTDTLSV